MKMWRDLSITTLPSPINAYEQYKPLNGGPPIVSSGGVGGGGGKWQNIPGTRSSYSLPHPAHVQSNQRWQHYGDRPISHSPSYQHIPSQIPPPNNDRGGGVNLRSRPVSMYDMPMHTMHQPHSFSSFTPQQLLPPPPPSSNHKSHSSHNINNNNSINNNNNHNSNNSHHHNHNGHAAAAKNGGGMHLRQKPGELVRKIYYFYRQIYINGSSLLGIMQLGDKSNDFSITRVPCYFRLIFFLKV